MFLRDNIFYNILKLLRPKQWYKNLLIFAALFFSLKLFDFYSIKITIFGFVILCLSSSANYIINDILDYEKDKLNPTKKNRPIANGKINRILALCIAIFLYLVNFYLAYQLNFIFFLIVLTLSILTFLYSICFKNEVILDIIFIAINFVLRALGGIFLINVNISLWFFLEIFFFAFFLVSSKRYVDLLKLNKSQIKYKPVLEKYSKTLVESMLIIFLTAIILTFGFYSYFTNYQLFILYPFLTYILLYYYNLVLIGDFRVQDPEKFIFEKTDLRLVLTGIIIFIITLIIYYGKWF